MKNPRKMYEVPEKPKFPKNRSTIFASEKNLEKQSKGIEFAQRRHLDEMKAMSGLSYNSDANKGRSLYVTVNPRGELNKFDDSVARSSANQRSTIFSNPVFLGQSGKFPQTQSKKHFLGDFKSQGLGVKASFHQSQPTNKPPSYKASPSVVAKMTEKTKEPLASHHKNMCSENNHLFQMLMSPNQQFTDKKFTNEAKPVQKKMSSQNASMVSYETSENIGFRRSGSVVAITRNTEYYSNLARGNACNSGNASKSCINAATYAKMARTSSTGKLQTTNSLTQKGSLTSRRTSKGLN